MLIVFLMTHQNSRYQASLVQLTRGDLELPLRAAGGQNGEPILFANEGTHADGAVALGVLTKEKGGLFS